MNRLRLDPNATPLCADLLIVITAHNHEDYVRRCYRSVVAAFRKQRYFNPTVVICDDSSTDNTWREIVFGCVDAVRGGTTVTCRVEFGSVEKTINHIVDRYASPYTGWILRIDADDYLPDDYFQKLSRAVLSKPRVELFYGNARFVTALKGAVAASELPPFDYEEIIKRGDFYATGTLLSMPLFKSIGGYEDSIHNSCVEQWWLILKAIKAGVKGQKVEGLYFYYQIHDSNLSKDNERVKFYGQYALNMLFVGRKYERNEAHAPWLNNL